MSTATAAARTIDAVPTAAVGAKASERRELRAAAGSWRRLANGSLLLVEKKTAHKPVLTEENFNRNEIHLTPLMRRLIQRLFKGVMTISEAREFFSSRSAETSAVHEANLAFREMYGAPAVLRTNFDGEGAAGLFWFLQLNPALFKAPRVRLVPGRNLHWQDTLPNAERRMVQFLLENPYQTMDAVSSSLGLDIFTTRGLLSGKINKRMRERGWPKAFCHTENLHPLHFVNPEFIEFFGETPRRPRISESVFSELEWRLITHLAEHPDERSPELTSAIGVSTTALHVMVRRVNKKARLFKLRAIEARGSQTRKRFSVCKKFADELGLEQAKTPVPNLFQQSYLDVLRIAIERPCCPEAVVAKELGATMLAVSRKYRAINRICSQFGLTGFTRVAKTNCFYATEEFARPFVERFGWEFKKVKREQLLLAEKVRRVGLFFIRNPEASVDECMKALVLKRHQVISARINCNKLFTAHGFPPLPCLRKAARFRDIAAAREAVIEYRMSHGRWPTRSLLKEARMDALDKALAKHHGGIDAVANEAVRDDGIVRKIAEADLRKIQERIESGEIDFSKFGDDGRTVARAVRNAILRGVELTELVQIIKESDGDWSATVEKITALICTSRVSIIEEATGFATNGDGNMSDLYAPGL